MKNLRMISSLKWLRVNFRQIRLIRKRRSWQKRRKKKPNKRKSKYPKLLQFLNKCLRKIKFTRVLKRSNKSYYPKSSKKHYIISKTTYNSIDRIVINNNQMNNKKCSNPKEIIPWISPTSKNANNTLDVMESSIGDASQKNRKNNTWKQK